MRTVKIEVDISEFSTRDMIDELQYRDIITIAEREALRERKKAPTDRSMNILSHHDAKMRVIAEQDRLVEEAEWNARRGDFKESIHCVVRAFPGLALLEKVAHA
jgi:hypothetical protein